MKVNNSNLLTTLAGIVGVTGISLLVNLSVRAQEKLNQNPSVFAEAPYNRSQRVLTNTQYIPSQPASSADKQNSKTQTQKVSQNSGLNPSPKILQECPYNRSACPSSGGSSAPAQSPDATPTPSGSEVTPPTTPDASPTPSETPSPGSPTKPGNRTDSNKTIIAVAEANGSFKTLIKALKAAGLTQTLEGKGPFTVFAPTDAAFGELPQDAVRDLLKPENKEVLVKILTYHVVAGQVFSSDLKSGEVKSSEGGAITVKVDPTTGVTVNDAKVVQRDIKARNGVIHVINKVILPPDL